MKGFESGDLVGNKKSIKPGGFRKVRESIKSMDNEVIGTNELRVLPKSPTTQKLAFLPVTSFYFLCYYVLK